MDSLEKMRAEIDIIDEALIGLLNDRFRITDEIGKYKKKMSMPLVHSKRENEILAKLESFEFRNELKELYQYIFIISKEQQRK